MRQWLRWTGPLPLLAAGGVALLAIGYRTLHDETGPRSPEAITPSLEEDPHQAITSLERQARAEPGSVEAWRLLARAQFALGDYAAAATSYERLTAIARGDASAWAALGEARTLASNAVTPPAHDAFTKATSLDPKNPRARYFLGVEKDVAGDHRGAVADWEGVLRDAPPGAPYAASVRRLLVEVGARDGTTVADRPALREPASPADGQAMAAAAIPGPTAAQMADAARLSPSQQGDMAKEMVTRLAARLAQSPRDLDGWIRMMRARLVMNDRAAALRALADGQQAFRGDAAATATLDGAARRLGL